VRATSRDSILLGRESNHAYCLSRIEPTAFVRWFFGFLKRI